MEHPRLLTHSALCCDCGMAQVHLGWGLMGGGVVSIMGSCIHDPHPWIQAGT